MASRLRRAALAAVVLALGHPATSPAAPVAGEIIVRYRDGATPSARAAARSRHGARVIQTFPRLGFEALAVEARHATAALAALAADPTVLYAEPNHTYHLLRLPGDERFGEQWSLLNVGQSTGTAGADIRAPRAWDLETDAGEVRIGVIDTGVDLDHPDLAANLWTNPGEIPGNQLDDDGNGYVDDVHGWNARGRNGNPDDDNGHGSHVAGTIAAVGDNGIGIAGVCWRAKIVAIKFLDRNGNGSAVDALASLEYALAAGVHLTNNSWGGGPYSQAMRDAIGAVVAAGQLFVAAAGNAASDNDRQPSYPASYDLPGMVTVAATDRNDRLASFSNFGAQSVHLAAPGAAILSLAPGGGYRVLSGTSMAAPHVAGVAALAMRRFPLAGPHVIRLQLLATADSLPDLAGRVTTGGRLNAFAALAEPDSLAPGAVTDLALLATTSSGFVLAWTATGDDGAAGRATELELRASTVPILSAADFDAARPLAVPRPEPGGTPATHEVRGLEPKTRYWIALRARDEFGNAGPLSNVVTAATLEPPRLEIKPEALAAEALLGGDREAVLTLWNTGPGTLDFEIPPPDLVLGRPAPAPGPPAVKGAPDARTGLPVADGRGGPDAFGYRWIDSREPGGPAYEWVDITATGAAVALSGDEAVTHGLPIGFPFPFYGESFPYLRITSNGYVSFTETNVRFDNQPLPAVDAPQNLVAAFWDDLVVGPSSSVLIENQGTRCVVSWLNVTAFPAGGPFDFQLILEPTGAIQVQYRGMGLPRNSATVGIQDGTRLRGLTVAFNTDYVDSGLAVRFIPTQPWLAVTPASGHLAAGESARLTARFRSFGLEGGRHRAALRVLTNDPARPLVTLPVEFLVIGAPDLVTVPAALEFGTVFLGQAAERTLTVTNHGTDRLEIAAFEAPDPGITVTPPALAVNPREIHRVTVRFAPGAVRALAGPLVVVSNDPDDPRREIPLSGAGREAPSVLIQPDTLAVALTSGAAVRRTLRLSNGGGADFVYAATAGPRAADPAAPRSAVPGGPPAPRPGRSGGPDRHGHTFRDSDDPGGPVFEWTDIRVNGTQLNLLGEDGNVGPLPIGFDFPFYGRTFSTFRVCLNGWISFTNTSTGRANYPLPSAVTIAPENLIAPFWDDLAFGHQRRAWYRNDGTRLIVQFHDVYRSGEPATFGNTFQAILYPNGTIVFQYLKLGAIDLASASVGIQNGTRDDGLQVAFDEPWLRDSLAVRILPPARFVTVTPEEGVVPPGGVVDLDVTLDAGELFGGTYDGAIRVTGNDPSVPERMVGVRLDVTGAPLTTFAPGALDFGTVFAGFPGVRDLQITNYGTDLLHVSDLAADDPAYTVDRTSLTLPPFGSATVRVSLGGFEAGPHDATLTLRSNDPVEARTRLALTGRIAEPPVLAVEPASLAASVAIPALERRTLALRNPGGSDLEFSTATLFEQDPPAAAAAPGASVLGGGGPDAYGYTWRDSDHSGGPTFEWVDIVGTGQPITFSGRGDDETVRDLPLGFDFPFYGATHRTVSVCSNGWLSFTSGTSVTPGNVRLPSAAAQAPADLIAAFWDDLNPGNTAVRLWTRSDGRRFVATWDAVLRNHSGGPYTFQVVLEPGGRILCQYRSMRGTRLGEATIGIQNAARDDGLTVAHDSLYVRDSLAVEFRPVPEYLRVRPAAGRVPAGGSLDLELDLVTEGLFGATYFGGLRLVTNDPHRLLTVIPVTLAAHGVPDIAADSTALDFGDWFAGATADRTLRLRNRGTDSLVVTALEAGGAFAVVDPPALPFTIGPRDPLPVTVRFQPPAPGPWTGRLTAVCNDPDQPAYEVALAGAGVPAPELAGLPASLSATFSPGIGESRAVRRIVIRNEGESPLRWRATPFSSLPAAPAPPAAAIAAAAAPEPAKGEDGPPGLPALHGAGGPDAFGYRFTDSDDPVGVPFAWEDITATGTRMPFELDDQTLGPYPLPFRFPFYGQTFDSVRVCSNGWLSFTSTRTSYNNTPLPNAGSGVPENLIAPFWEDLTYSLQRGDAFRHADPRRAVFSFHRVRRYGGDGFMTFQALLFPNGTIDFQYLQMDGRADNATIGIQNAARNVGLQVAYNTTYARNGLRVRIAPRGGWLAAGRAEGAVAPGASDTVEVIFDGSGHGPGTHDGWLRIATNDVDEPVVDVPCRMTLGRRPTPEPASAAAEASREEAGSGALPPAAFALRVAGPQPARSAVELELELPAAAVPAIAVLDVRGARVARLDPGPLPAGRHLVRWDGRDGSGSAAPPGVYFVIAADGRGGRQVARIVRLDAGR